MIRLQTEDCNRCNCGGRHTYNLTDNCLEIFLARIKLSKVKYGENPQSEPNADKENLKENAFRVHNTSTQVPRQIRAKRSIAHIKVLIKRNTQRRHRHNASERKIRKRLQQGNCSHKESHVQN
jgi:hypothetical protein